MSTLRILHLDQDRRDALVVARNVRSAGLDAAVVHVATGEAYAAALEDATIGLVLAHGPVSGLTGQDAVALARRRRPGVPVIVLSDDAGPPGTRTLRETGATDCVPRHDWPRLMAVIGRAAIAAA